MDASWIERRLATTTTTVSFELLKKEKKDEVWRETVVVLWGLIKWAIITVCVCVCSRWWWDWVNRENSMRERRWLGACFHTNTFIGLCEAEWWKRMIYMEWIQRERLGGLYDEAFLPLIWIIMHAYTTVREDWWKIRSFMCNNQPLSIPKCYVIWWEKYADGNILRNYALFMITPPKPFHISLFISIHTYFIVTVPPIV